MFGTIMNLGIVGMIISIFVIYFIPTKKFSEDTASNALTVALLLFCISVFACIFGAFFSSELGAIILL